jgi:hypothetical protein
MPHDQSINPAQSPKPSVEHKLPEVKIHPPHHTKMNILFKGPLFASDYWDYSFRTTAAKWKIVFFRFWTPAAFTGPSSLVPCSAQRVPCFASEFKWSEILKLEHECSVFQARQLPCLQPLPCSPAPVPACSNELSDTSGGSALAVVQRFCAAYRVSKGSPISVL